MGYKYYFLCFVKHLIWINYTPNYATIKCHHHVTQQE